MILEFPGTKGEIEESSLLHNYHSSIIINYKDTKVIIDYGEKHAPGLDNEINHFDAVLITHAHPDHYIWTKKDDKSVLTTVYLTKITYDYSKYKPLNFNIVEHNKEFKIKNLIFTPVNLIHSLRCPAVCYKIRNNKNLIYAPDILDFEIPKEDLLKDIDFLIADGSSINVNLVRSRDGKLFGHAMLKTIIGWCKKAGIRNLIITHCGKQIVSSDEKEVYGKLFEYGENKVNIEIAFDGYKKEI
ncbi:MAG: MBL fold metallo-hydrolase [Actinobacteria bacterium]|nr:MBL fold metallo-hydrolase [Actinomycetota bacterium]